MNTTIYINIYEQFKTEVPTGKKVTIIGFGEFGFLAKTQTTIQEINKKPHYQNCPESMMGVELIHKPKGKRQMFRKRIESSSNVLVYDGWIDIDIEDIMYKKEGIMQYTKYPCFDKRFLEDIIKTVTDTPIMIRM